MLFMLIAAVATFLNFAIVIWKFSSERILDGILDLGIFAVIAFLFQGTITGLQIGMIASMMVSVYLIFVRPTFPSI